MDTNSLRYFKVIAQLGNMSRAAQELHVSQPTLTVTIKKMEETLGVTLFERSKKGVTLTPAGINAYKYAEQMLQLWEDLRQGASALEHEVKGTIHVGVHPSVARYTLPHFLPQLFKEHMDLNIQFHHDLSRHILTMVLDHRCDVGLVINPEKHPDLIIKEILQDEVTVWKRKGAKNTETLIYDANLFQCQTIIDKLKKKNISYKRLITSTNLEVVASLLEAGTGHAILPKRVAIHHPFPLEEAHAEITPFKDSLNLVYRPQFRKTALGRAFIEAVTDTKF